MDVREAHRGQGTVDRGEGRSHGCTRRDAAELTVAAAGGLHAPRAGVAQNASFASALPTPASTAAHPIPAESSAEGVTAEHKEPL